MSEANANHRDEPPATMAGFVVRPRAAHEPAPRGHRVPPVFTTAAPDTPALRALVLGAAIARLDDDERRRHR